MPTTRYIYSNGVKIAQVKDGVRTDYLTDALGSITATKNQSQTIVNTYRYKPYGGLLARTGTGADPKYLWTGNTGSRVTYTRFANQYNVARHYANSSAAWTTADPLWPATASYPYADSKPTYLIDRLGRYATAKECDCAKCDPYVPRIVPPPHPVKDELKKSCESISKCYAKRTCRKTVTQCMKDCGIDDPEKMFNCMSFNCTSAEERIQVLCMVDDFMCMRNDACALTFPGKPCVIGICAYNTREACKCIPGYNKSWHERCAVPACASEGIGYATTLVHEMTHCCGLGPDGGIWGWQNGGKGDCVALCFSGLRI